MQGGAVVHTGFTTAEFRSFFEEAVKPYEVAGIWLNADKSVLQQRMAGRLKNNKTHATSDISTLDEVYARQAIRLDGWTEVDTTDVAPYETANQIIQLAKAKIS